MNSFKLLQLAKTCLGGRQESPLFTHFLSFYPSVALLQFGSAQVLCNSKKSTTGQIPKFQELIFATQVSGQEV